MNESSIIDALRQQVECYRQLAKLAELQHAHVEQNQTEALLEVLRDRQGMLDRIAALERTIAPVKRKWAEVVASVSEPLRDEVEALLGETRRLLEQITASDRNDVLLLQQRKLNLGKQIRQAQAARTVNRSYGSSAYAAGSSNMDVQR